LNLSAFQGFVDQQATKISGIATGNIKVGGNTALPEINGEISLSKVGGEITFLNQYLTIDEGKISIDPDGVYFPHFVVKDAQNNAAIITGSIGMRALQNFRYNIVVLTDNFTVMNSTRKNNKMLNGKMIVSSNIRIRGEALKPDIEATVKLVDGSNICFTVPESQLSADKGEGIVEFDVDTISLNPIIRKALLQKKVSSDVKGVHIISNIELNKRSTLKLVLDPTQADTLIVRGDANLSFAPDESGKMSLTGTYVVDNGSYELSLQDIVKKKFFISRGSTIIWNGDPLDALVDITAQHNVKTSPADLLASSAGGKVGVDRNTTKNALNFFVKIFMKGALLKPNLKFGLDMEPSQQQAFGGTVYAKINALNASESELNKQVFSLLVLGTFMPTSNTFGNGADYNGIARSSASSILSSQLNALSAQYIKGVEVNFDLQSYNDYASGQKTGNTQLSVGVKKQFFDDKLSVQIGSNIGLEGQKSSQNNLSNFTGNIVMEYKLTKDGNYRLKAFRQNQYEGLIYGVVVKTGAGIIYSRDYDIFGELFKNRDRIGR
ncbi:MAG: translocation/assembly module TamB domain-containing protein, partial [Cytophagales bacterium]